MKKQKKHAQRYIFCPKVWHFWAFFDKLATCHMSRIMSANFPMLHNMTLKTKLWRSSLRIPLRGQQRMIIFIWPRRHSFAWDVLSLYSSAEASWVILISVNWSHKDCLAHALNVDFPQSTWKQVPMIHHLCLFVTHLQKTQFSSKSQNAIWAFSCLQMNWLEP